MVEVGHTFKRKFQMKKIVIAAILAAASLGAMAQATVYGKLNATVDNTKTGSTAGVGSIVNDSSRIGVSVKETLGNGLSARVVVETAVNSQNPTTGSATQLGDRQSTVGLVHRLGSVDIGRNTHGLFNTVGAADAFDTSYGSVAGDIHNLRGLRLGNGVFATVTAVPGVKLGVDRTNTATGTEAAVYSASAAVGPINTGVAYFEQGAEKSTVIGAGTKLGSTGLFYSYSDNKGAVASKGHLVGATRSFGAYTAKVSYGETNTDVKAYNVGVDYALSKRTVAGVAYRKVDAATDVRQVGVGITHSF
jgi:predicted porin